jgi:hypothetical protein
VDCQVPDPDRPDPPKPSTARLNASRQPAAVFGSFAFQEIFNPARLIDAEQELFR